MNDFRYPAKPDLFPENVATTLAAAIGLSVTGYALKDDRILERAHLSGFFTEHPVDRPKNAEAQSTISPHAWQEIEASVESPGIEGGPDLLDRLHFDKIAALKTQSFWIGRIESRTFVMMQSSKKSSQSPSVYPPKEITQIGRGFIEARSQIPIIAAGIQKAEWE